MKISRRTFLTASAVSSAGLMLSPTVFAVSKQRNELPIPPLYEGDVSQGKKHFSLNVRHGETEFFKGYGTQTLGFNGSYLGPTLKVNKGDLLSIQVKNQLSEDTTVHWHGMILPARMDGGPHQNIKPGHTWTSEYKVLQRASTLFYHSHAHGQTGQQVYRGMAGLLLIDDDEQQSSKLPKDYGVDDIPVVMQDRDFDSDGQLKYIGFMPERMMGKHGKTMIINGAYSPVLKAKRTLLRLRLVNASNARFYNLGFSDDRNFQVIASDGGLLPEPIQVTRLEMAPAERYEILVDVSDKQQIMLKSFGGVGNVGHGMMSMMMGGDSEMDVLLIDAQQATKSKASSSPQLTTLPNWVNQTVGEPVRRLELQMGMMGGGMMGGGMMRGMGRGSGGMMRINGNAFNMNRVDFSVKNNQYEVWELGNESPMVHPFHIHNTQFKVLSRNGRTVKPFEHGLKDTVIVHQNESVQVLVPTGPFSDPSRPYMYHCHILEHEDGGMMGQFVVNS